MLIEELSLTSVRPDENQPRRTTEDKKVRELADSLDTVGQVQPIITCRLPEPDQYLCIEGHCRLKAASLLGWTTLLAIVHDEKPESADLVRMQLTANCLRFDLKPSELAKAVHALKESEGYSNVEVAGFLAMSKTRVTQVLSYLTLPDDIIDKIDAGELAGSTAYAIARMEPTERSRFISAARNGKVRRSDALTKRGKQPRKQASRFRFQMPRAEVAVSSPAKLDLAGLIDLLQESIKELRAAEKRRIDARTLERVLAAQRGHEAIKGTEALTGESK